MQRQLIARIYDEELSVRIVKTDVDGAALDFSAGFEEDFGAVF
jgi:hypothetical protein